MKGVWLLDARTRGARRWRALSCALLVLCLSMVGAASASAQSPKVLVFHGGANATNDAGVAAITALGAANGFGVEASADATTMTAANLATYRAVVFLKSKKDPSAGCSYTIKLIAAERL